MASGPLWYRQTLWFSVLFKFFQKRHFAKLMTSNRLSAPILGLYEKLRNFQYLSSRSIYPKNLLYFTVYLVYFPKARLSCQLVYAYHTKQKLMHYLYSETIQLRECCFHAHLHVFVKFHISLYALANFQYIRERVRSIGHYIRLDFHHLKFIIIMYNSL